MMHKESQDSTSRGTDIEMRVGGGGNKSVETTDWHALCI